MATALCGLAMAWLLKSNAYLHSPPTSLPHPYWFNDASGQGIALSRHNKINQNSSSCGASVLARGIKVNEKSQYICNVAAKSAEGKIYGGIYNRR